MPQKSYQVRFAQTYVGNQEEAQRTLGQCLPGVAQQHGPNLPTIQLEGELHQIRNLLRVGTLWRGCFARLRDQAPHIVDVEDQERELDLEDGEHIVEKCYFLYYSETDILVFQMNRDVGYLSRFEDYLARLFGEYVNLAVAMDGDAMNQILNAHIREIEFTYARPPGNAGNGAWDQRSFDLLRSVQGAQGTFLLKASRGQSLGGHIREMVQWAARGGQVRRAKVRLTDETDPIDLFLAPIKRRISVPMHGKYPDERATLERLADAYEIEAPRLPLRQRRNAA